MCQHAPPINCFACSLWGYISPSIMLSLTEDYSLLTTCTQHFHSLSPTTSLLFISNCSLLSAVSFCLCQPGYSFGVHCWFDLPSDASLTFLLSFLRVISHNSATVHFLKLLNLWITGWIAHKSITVFDYRN